MKKLFVILAVLALVSASSAAIMSLQVAAADQKAAYARGDTITIELVSSVQTTSFGNIALQDDSGLIATVANLAVSAGWTNSYEGMAGAMAPVFVEAPFGIMTGTPVPAHAAGLMWSFDYTIPNAPVGMTQIIISPYVNEEFGYFAPVATRYSDLTDVTGIDSLAITIPEPMTIALLGLGGLFLRRKLS